MSRLVPGAWLVGVCLLAACGGGLLGEEIGCDWFSGENCWKTSMADAATCAHPLTEKGTLQPDGKRCSFADGTLITFNIPVDLANVGEQSWDFTIENPDGWCLSFQEPQPTLRVLQTASGTYREEVINVGLQITCPSGARYKVLNANNLLSCEDWAKIVPGVKLAWTDTGFSFSFLGASDGNLHLFACELEP